MAKLEYIQNSSIKETHVHRSIHICDQCPYGSKSVFFMLNHVKRHRLPSRLFDCTTSLEVYCCKNCDINFDTILDLGKHIEKHSAIKQEDETTTKPKNLISPTKNEDDLLLHKILQHSKLINKNNNSFKCDKCAYKTANGTYFRKHIYAKHTDDKDKEWFQCDKCVYKTCIKSNLANYVLLSHDDERENKKWFPCENCEYKTIRKGSLQCQKWFRCTKCTYRSTQKYYLEIHVMAKHTKDKDKKWYHCEKCTFKTVRRGCLISHYNKKHPKR